MPPSRPPGFTLIELIASLAIVTALAVLLLPAASNIRKSAQSATTLNNLRQLAGAAAAHARENDNRYFGNSLDSPKYWLREFWPYAYPDRAYPAPNFSAADSGEVFRGTIFHTPLLEKKPIYGGQPRSFGYNYPLEEKSGKNLRYSLLVRNASKVALFGDTRTSGSWTPAQVNARYKNSVHVAFLDQHVELVPLSSIPTSKDAVFWSGISE